MQERVQLAGAVAEKYGHQLTELEDWRPLLRYSQGNPMTITAVVGQALRNGFRTREQIEDFVFQLRSGEAEIDDDESEGRSKSLGASLSYGFEHAFSDEERQHLALLHFFQGFVDVNALRVMGKPDQDWCVPVVSGLTREAGIALLDRAAEVGLLTSLRGDGSYTIHPVLPWYFKKLFDQYYLPDQDNNPKLAARAFVEVMGVLGEYYFYQYEAGNRDVIDLLTAEEANLLHARQLARANGWWDGVLGTMQGLRQVYDQTGRRAEWARLVEEIMPDFVDLATDSSLPEREEKWGVVTQYRVRLAMEARQWAEAERLQRACLAWDRQRAASALAVCSEALDSTQRYTIRQLAVSLNELGLILREQGKADCVAAHEESLTLDEQIGDKAGAAISAFSLGHAYMDISAIRNLEQADHWYRRSLQLHDDRDRLGRSKCLNQLGLVAYEHFEEARAVGQPDEELLRHLNDALQFYHQTLDLLPPNAMDDLAVTHDQLGNIYSEADDLDRALLHYCEAIRYKEEAGDLYHVAQTRFNVAAALADADRFDDALLYAQAALRNFETYGDSAAADIQKTQQLIAIIEQYLETEEG
jgi:tetratricopeptide (TPR) repeat protein